MELISFENLTPEERTKAKNKEATEIVLAKTEQYAKQEKAIENAKNGISKGYNNQIIADIAALPIEQIEQLRSEIRNN